MCTREILDDWFNNVWGKKLQILGNFSQMVQKEMFIVFLKNHVMQEKVLKKGLWYIAQTLFRAFPWAPKRKPKHVHSSSSLLWVEIKGVQPEFWSFISHMLKPLATVLQVEE